MVAVCAACGGSSPPPADDKPETLAADEGTGTDVDTPDPGPETDSCIDGDECDDVVADVADDPTIPRFVETNAYTPGLHLITLTYAPLRRTASSKSALVSTIASGVPRDKLHAWGQPEGYVPPGQTVVLVAPTGASGYSKVAYDGKIGWILSKKLDFANRDQNPVDFAMRSAVRNAFFKHQIHRVVWNKDGPSSSGNCAPTSLAMAIHVLGKEPADRSIEESIHRARLEYGMHSDSGPTSRAQIHKAAVDFGFHVEDLATDMSPSAALRRLANQLDKKRVVVLEGQPGQAGSTPTVYQAAMNRAYAAAKRNGESLYHSTYTFDGYHSIFVLGRNSKGDYLVGDPLSEVGFVALAPHEMEDFITRWHGHRGTGTAVWK
jgi:hypothetical protein